MFVNPKAPGSAYGMTYNCIACGNNALTFNDGYHIQHHLNSRTHWSELPLRFVESLEEHVAQAGDHLGILLCTCKYVQVLCLIPGIISDGHYLTAQVRARDVIQHAVCSTKASLCACRAGFQGAERVRGGPGSVHGAHGSVGGPPSDLWRGAGTDEQV